MENLNKKPAKGILKSSSSFEQAEAQQRALQAEKDIKWDEMNILQTLHPPDKDYGHMKVEEPKTPFNYLYSEENDVTDQVNPFDPNVIAMKIGENEVPKVLQEEEEEEEEEDEDENLTEEEKLKKKEFEVKRKMHYNEFQAVKLARKLLEEEEEDEDEGENGDGDKNVNIDEKGDSNNSEPDFTEEH